MKIENHTLILGETLLPLPHLATPATVDVWTVPTDYRADGYFVAVTPAGRPPEIPACAMADTEYLGQLALAPDDDALLDAARQAALARINAACSAALAALAASYPDGEVTSWAQQVREAEALAHDAEADTPLLSAIAGARGLTVAVLAERVQAKAAAYALASGALIGRRQAAEDRIAAAGTLDQVQEVTW